MQPAAPHRRAQLALELHSQAGAGVAVERDQEHELVLVGHFPLDLNGEPIPV